MVTTSNENNFVHNGVTYYNLYFKTNGHELEVLLKYESGHYTGKGYLVEEYEDHARD